MLTLEVGDFGPIRRGGVGLKPLTIFVGPNNSGKSYFAMLFYAVHVAPYAHFGTRYRFHRSERPYFYPYLLGRRTRIVDAERSALAKWVKELPKGAGAVRYTDLPAVVRKKIDEAVKSYFEALQSGLAGELTRCFGALLPELSRKAPSGEHFSIRLSYTAPAWSLSAYQSNTTLKTRERSANVADQVFNLHEIHSDLLESPGSPPEIVFAALVQAALLPLARCLPNAYYFPAARSGILQSHKALANFLVRQSPLAGVERIEVPQLSGVITDFVGELLTIEEARESSPISHIASEFERSLLEGDISLDSSALPYPEIYYNPAMGRFPLHRTSSMVSELAPIILFLKHKVRPRDLLIIEEPESHLHPASQLRFARLLAKLVNAKVRIILTTHSDYLITQIGNFIRAARQRKEPPGSELPTLKTADVGAYLFGPTEDGTVVTELPISREGIPEDDFARVQRELYEERVALQP